MLRDIDIEMLWPQDKVNIDYIVVYIHSHVDCIQFSLLFKLTDSSSIDTFYASNFDYRVGEKSRLKLLTIFVFHFPRI